MESANDPEVIEVEAEPLDDSDAGESGGDTRWMRPLMGLLLDAADFVTPAALPAPIRLVVGAGLGWWVGGQMKLDPKQRTLLAAAGAAYCTIKGTGRLPIGTLIGTLSSLGVRFGR